MKKLTVVILFAVFLSACASAPSGGASSTPIVMTGEASTVIPEGGATLTAPEPPTTFPTLAGGLSITELKYKVLEMFPDFFYCDPDYYPVARLDETTLALQAYPELQADQEQFQAILNHLGLGGQTTFSDEQKLALYREHKRLNAVNFQLDGDRYQFQIQTGEEGQQGAVITGAIDASGSIEISQREQAFPACPICLAAGTLIDTPRGPIRVEDLREGEPVWTQDEAGRRVQALVLRTGRVPVPPTHAMIHITLSDGRQLWASPGHPTADGRRLGDLHLGETLDGARIAALAQVAYGEDFTYDLLPAGATGLYWANGVLMGSTLSFSFDDAIRFRLGSR